MQLRTYCSEAGVAEKLTAQIKFPTRGVMRECAQCVQSFPKEIGKDNAFIKAYKRSYSLTRITVLKKLLSFGYSFSQKIIERQHRIVEQEKQ